MPRSHGCMHSCWQDACGESMRIAEPDHVCCVRCCVRSVSHVRSHVPFARFAFTFQACRFPHRAHMSTSVFTHTLRFMNDAYLVFLCQRAARRVWEASER